MFFGPLRWPPLRVWLAAAGMTAFCFALLALGISAEPVIVGGVVIVLVVAAPARVRELGGDELGESRPDRRSDDDPSDR
jgi:hypothetical protein